MRTRSPVRISFSALLRVVDDDRYVLFASRTRPGACGPPGGVFKYFAPAARILESLEFQQERIGVQPERARWDLRGLLPASAVREVQKWFLTGAYRETATECLRRELHEELHEVGLAHLAPQASSLAFSHVRTVVEGPHPVHGRPYWQLRRFEVYDMVTDSGDALRLRARLAACGRDDAYPDVISANWDDIAHGRLGKALIAPPSSFLLGPTRLAPDVPPLR
ncbi:hypothetical protein [Kibdelosporangium phytohabitans]|uniref:SMODS-associated NUDIX domain-containing protein n=1 Tax=Kibdelosporangium phytohabitans TaxID=860235 RepID=UPI0012FB241C|nr:hypothetical protein [Kibdelosporangium phytohabitans]